VISSLRRQQRLQHELGTGQLSLNLESRKLMYAGDVVQLSPAEVPLAELFMSHVGSVIPIDEIHLMFQLTGRSLSGSNIRVTIFQLRFKIELLTRHQFTLACAYGEGYALRPGKGSAEPPSHSLTAMQSSTLHYG
jgi:DNA-binding response OmpR family regulator